jgi:hypothetical protein
MNNAGCTEFKTPPFCFVLMMALVAAVLAFPISRLCLKREIYQSFEILE